MPTHLSICACVKAVNNAFAHNTKNALRSSTALGYRAAWSTNTNTERYPLSCRSNGPMRAMPNRGKRASANGGGNIRASWLVNQLAF